MVVTQIVAPQPSDQADASKLKVWLDKIGLKGGSEILPAKKGVTVIVGANNVGKTTLLSEINDLLVNQFRNYGEDPYKLIEPQGRLQSAGSRDDLLAWLHENAQWGRDQGNPMQTPMFRRQGQTLQTHVVDQWAPGALLPDPFWVKYFSAGAYGGGFQASRSPVGVAPSEPTQVLYEQPDVMQRLNNICFEVFGFCLTLDDESPDFRLLVGVPDVARPPHGEDRRDYRDALSQLEPLSSQGHGVTGFMSVITQLVTGAHAVILADEPEVFLHPPQARALGRYLARLASEQNGQVILATHDRNLLSGLLEENEPLSVVRLVRTPERTYARQLHADSVRELWADPVLRYSDVLDGLFHKVVYIAEGHRDCTFYRAATEYHGPLGDEGNGDRSPSQTSTLRLSDIMFMPSNGKQAIPKLIAALAAVSVPVVVIPDLDVLHLSDGLLERLVGAMGGEWPSVGNLARLATNSLTQPTALTKVSLIRTALSETFDEILAEDANSIWDKETKKRVSAVLRAAAGPSETLKKLGSVYASGQERRDFESLLQNLQDIGLVPVRVGELERFAPDLNQNKTTWLEDALASEAYKNAEAQSHAARCLIAAEMQLRRRSFPSTADSGKSN